MSNRTISAGRTPKITIESAGGDLSIVGWDGEDLLIKADEDDARFSQDGDRVVISSSDDLSLRVPRLASLTVEIVAGDIALRGVNGDISINEIHGDASMREVNNIAIGSVKADLSLRTARGSVAVKSVSGDAVIREVQGNVALDSVADDLVLREVRGNVKANVGGDVVLSLDPQPGNAYAVNAGDDVMLMLPSTADASLALSGDEIFVDWPGIPYEEEAVSRTVTLGSGAASIAISAGGELHVRSQDKAQQSPEDFGNFAGMMFDWSDFGNQLGANISRRVEQVTRRAASQAERAARKAEAKLRARGRGRVDMGGWDWNIDSSSITPPAPREPVSEQERLQILKMLAEKKITAEEADKLLAALEGGQ
jgi:hypothetical protein